MNTLNRSAVILTCLLGLLFLDGCVERRLLLRSDPVGARVILNGEPVGITPVNVPFLTYGTFDVIMSAPGHHRLHEAVPVKPPWWETIPLDLLVENVLPFVVKDEREIMLSLKPFDANSDAGIDAREKALRERLEIGEGS